MTRRPTRAKLKPTAQERLLAALNELHDINMRCAKVAISDGSQMYWRGGASAFAWSAELVRHHFNTRRVAKGKR